MQIILFSAGAGIFAMGFGGFISATLLKRSSAKVTCWLLSFAAGIMTSIVCFGLMPEAVELSGITVSIFGLILGIVVVMLLNRIVDKITEAKDGGYNIHHTHEELYHQSPVIHNRSKMLRSGIIMLTAIGLHNIPEGIAIGAGGSRDYHLGAIIAIMIALHNIPEGMAVAAPLLAGGFNKRKAVLLTALAGSLTILGALVGILIGNISDFAVALSLSSAGGAMLYVVFGEIIPQSVVITKSRAAPLITLFGIIIGLIITVI
ncbi:MAG: ZIP family metal transporter [Oscillospiraceae bacterium]|nr:ZIP family metal transporter [Oscillospiraceae bacterium]